MISVPRFDASSHVSHEMHADGADWPETNCYIDLFVELLHGMGLDPVAGLSFVFSAGFDGEQWEFFKYPHEDLRVLYGIEVHEMNAWRPLADHIQQHFELGHFLTVEADSWFLPDTAGVSYQIGHQKTTITPVGLDVTEERMTYVHNRGCYELSGQDFRGALQIDKPANTLPPYVEMVDVSSFQSYSRTDLRERAQMLLRGHLERQPEVNPIGSLSDRVREDLQWLRSDPDPELFHQYAFGTLRQLGAWASCAARFASWFDPDRGAGASEQFAIISESAKSAQFVLARAARTRCRPGHHVREHGRSMGHWVRGYRADTLLTMEVTAWEVARAAPGSIDDPLSDGFDLLDWCAGSGPGTAASMLPRRRIVEYGRQDRLRRR